MRSPAQSVPQIGGGAVLIACRENVVDQPLEQLDVAPDERAGPLADGDRPFGVFPQGQARNPQHGRFFLQPAGVGDDQRACDERLRNSR